ncbi:MAG: hypothetical protein VW445_12440, partial [Rhodospirillaceae bacterium]
RESVAEKARAEAVMAKATVILVFTFLRIINSSFPVSLCDSLRIGPPNRAPETIPDHGINNCKL